MSLIAPTADDICGEGFQRVAGRPATPQELARANRFWLEETFAEVWARGTQEDRFRLRALENTAVQVLDAGIRRYDWPSDFYRPISAVLLKGDIAGTFVSEPGTSVTATSGASVAWASEASADLLAKLAETAGANTTLSGLWLIVTSGDAEGALREIASVTISSSGGTTYYRFNLDRAWSDDELPVTADTFVVVSQAGDLLPEDLARVMDNGGSMAGTGVPGVMSNFDRMLELDVAPDDEETYVLVMRYFVDLMKVQKDSTVMQEILRQWRAPLTRGIAKIAAQDLDDSRYATFRKEWEDALVGLLAQDSGYWPDFAGLRPG